MIGRRYIQTRLVEPSANSMNSGDVFLVVTKDKLFHWVGKSSNVIEKARVSQVSSIYGFSCRWIVVFKDANILLDRGLYGSDCLNPCNFSHPANILVNMSTCCICNVALSGYLWMTYLL